MADYVGARPCLEPLLTVDNQGRLSPVLAAEVPSLENGGLPDGRTVIYRLRPSLTWADGQPFTAADVAFTFEFVADPQTAATSFGTYQMLERVEALDTLTVKLTFRETVAGWYVPFVGTQGMILPRHAFAGDAGPTARSVPFNLKPFGTGPFVVEEFKPGDFATYRLNPRYRDPDRPFFNRLELKGGGDAASAARAVLQTGEYDYAGNLQVEAQLLEQLASGGQGELVIAAGAGVERIIINQADPNQEVDGERSHPSTRHPFLTDPRVRQALALTVDRETIARELYGRFGEPASNVLTTPSPLASSNGRIEVDPDRANQILDQAGYRRGGDGIRLTPDGERMKVVFATVANPVRQKTQAIVKEAWQKIGLEVELRAVDPASYLSSGATNPDAAARFPADVQMATGIFTSPFPATYMQNFYARDPARDWAQKANNWTGRNNLKWQDGEYDRLYERALADNDPEQQRRLWHRLNDIVVFSHAVIPLVDRKFVAARAAALAGPELRAFDVETWNIAEWRRS